jgi:hypothetical protein
MTTPKPVVDLLTNAADELHTAVHATRPAGGRLTSPTGVYDILGALTQLTGPLPQLLDQLDDYVTGIVDAGRVNTDGGEYADDPQAAAAAASWWLDSARAAASQLNHHLDQARESVAFMTDTAGDNPHDSDDVDATIAPR